MPWDTVEKHQSNQWNLVSGCGKRKNLTDITGNPGKLWTYPKVHLPEELHERLNIVGIEVAEQSSLKTVQLVAEK